MSMGLMGAIVTVIVFVMFVVLVAFIIPTAYNHNLKSDQTHTGFCSDLHDRITQATDKNVIIALSAQYQQSCSS